MNINVTFWKATPTTNIYRDIAKIKRIFPDAVLKIITDNDLQTREIHKIYLSGNNKLWPEKTELLCSVLFPYINITTPLEELVHWIEDKTDKNNNKGKINRIITYFNISTVEWIIQLFTDISLYSKLLRKDGIGSSYIIEIIEYLIECIASGRININNIEISNFEKNPYKPGTSAYQKFLWCRDTIQRLHEVIKS